MPKQRTLLIDADILAYQTSAATEQKFDWGDTGGEVKSTDFDAAKRDAEATLDSWAEKLKADKLIICLSDDLNNFRNDVWSGYKQNRTGTERPEHLYDMKEWLGNEYETDLRAYLEADDVMGILATEPHDDIRIIVSEDKDMQTVPCNWFNPRKHKKPVKITPEFAQRFMLWQCLTGDPTDGYKGCPGVGPLAADHALDNLKARLKYDHELRSGPRKGETEKRRKWVSFDTRWEAIVSLYEDAGLNEAAAIQQVNLARILKHSDMDGSRIIPWVPSMLEKEGN